MLRVCVLEGDEIRTGGAELLAHPGPLWVDIQAPDEALLQGPP